MKIILLLIVTLSFAWSYIRAAQQQEIRLASDRQQTETSAVCPHIKEVNAQSEDGWKHIRGNENTPEYLLRDYHNNGRNAFGVIRTI
ncbi:MAG: hypothetical protein ABW092_18475 [Candidatus Thiodiazotropha sp.]